MYIIISLLIGIVLGFALGAITSNLYFRFRPNQAYDLNRKLVGLVESNNVQIVSPSKKEEVRKFYGGIAEGS